MLYRTSLKGAAVGAPLDKFALLQRLQSTHANVIRASNWNAGIIHAVGPSLTSLTQRSSRDEDEYLLRKCVRNAMRLAAMLGCRSIVCANPNIKSAGISRNFLRRQWLPSKSRSRNNFRRSDCLPETSSDGSFDVRLHGFR